MSDGMYALGQAAIGKQGYRYGGGASTMSLMLLNLGRGCHIQENSLEAPNPNRKYITKKL